MATTRQQYLSGAITHEDYYTKICNDAGVAFTRNNQIVKRALKSDDEHYNDIELSAWDCEAFCFKQALRKAFKDNGDSYSMAGAVCAMKQAVRNAIKK